MSARVNLQRPAVGGSRQQLLTAQNAFEPAEKQFHCPPVTVSQCHQFGRQIESIGEQPPCFQLTVVVGSLDLHQSNLMVLQNIFVMRCSQSSHKFVTDHACLASFGGGVAELRRRYIAHCP